MVTTSAYLELLNGDTAPSNPSGSSGVGGYRRIYMRGGQLYALDSAGAEVSLSGVGPSRLVIAGAGMTGGGDLSADRTFNVIANADGTITVNADDIQVGTLIAGNVPNNFITLAKLANLAANSILGNNTGSAATPIALTPAQIKALLAIASGDVSGLGALATLSAVGSAQITDNSVANGDLAQLAAFTVKGNNTAATANVGDLTVAQVMAMLNFLGGGKSIVVAGTALTNGTGEQTLYASQALKLTAASIAANDCIQAHAGGTLTNSTVAAFLTARCHIGPLGTVSDPIAAVTAVSPNVGSAAAHQFQLDAYLTCRSAGAGGTVIGDIGLTGSAVGAVLATAGASGATAAVALNTTVDNYITLSIQQSAASFTGGAAQVAFISRKV